MASGSERAGLADVAELTSSVALGKAPPDGDAKAHAIAPEGVPAASALPSPSQNGPSEKDESSESPYTALPPEAPSPSAPDGDPAPAAALPSTAVSTPGGNSNDVSSDPRPPGDSADGAAAVVRSPQRPPHSTPRSLRLRLHTTAHSPHQHHPHQKPHHQASPPTSPNATSNAIPLQSTVPDSTACNRLPPDDGGNASHPPTEAVTNHLNDHDRGDCNGGSGDLGTLDLDLDLDLDTLSFLDAMESFAEGITAGGGGGGMAAGWQDGAAGGMGLGVDGFRLAGAGRDGGGEDGDDDDEGNAAMMDCLEVPAGGCGRVLERGGHTSAKSAGGN